MMSADTETFTADQRRLRLHRCILFRQTKRRCESSRVSVLLFSVHCRHRRWYFFYFFLRFLFSFSPRIRYPCVQPPPTPLKPATKQRQRSASSSLSLPGYRGPYSPGSILLTGAYRTQCIGQ